jgi:antitoxin VapB
MNAYTTRTFRSGNSEAVRLPKDIGFGPDVEVVIRREGDTLIITPKAKTMAELVRRLREIGAPPDGVQEREPIEWPERPGL